ncbi:hypothetical protein tb265_21950 [Gemmatimonadetes bacterium T265]|nr:hypothetical protein tb265_21950 [Gemmatimonadetes bacterium T265]
MQHPVNPASPRSPVTMSDTSSRDAGGDARSTREVPDAQLWRDAIGAARRAAAEAAEIRLAIEAARPATRD